MNLSINESQAIELTDILKKSAEIVQLFTDNKVPKETLLEEVSYLEGRDWAKENMFNKLLGYSVLGDAYCALKTKCLSCEQSYYNEEYVYKEISYYHNVHYVVSKVMRTEYVALYATAMRTGFRAYLCLANAYDHQGRFCEAQQYYHLASKDIHNVKDVEINQALSYANMHSYWVNEEPWIVRRAQILMNKYSQDIDQCTPGLRLCINSMSTPQSEPPTVNFTNLANGHYEKWVNENYLRVNRYCDVDYNSELSILDNVVFPNIQGPRDRKELFASLYEEIFQTFLCTRKLLYRSMEKKTPLHNELLKMVYKNFYSILDKIAMCVGLYLQLPIKNRDMDFLKIWRGMKLHEIRPEILSQKGNISLVALFNIKLDVYGSDMPGFVMDEQTKDLKTIRNYIEHRFVNINETSINITEEQLTLSKNELFLNSIRLAQLVRCAIIYLCNFVMHAEYDKQCIKRESCS